MKILAETTGDFLLLDLSTGDTLEAHRPSVVSRSGFLDARIALHQVTKLADLPDDATDAEFAGYWTESEGDKALAVESYLSKFEAPVAKKRSK